jgi:co-chaperonin GroES (HSP10)
VSVQTEDLLNARLMPGFCVIEPLDLPETTKGGIILSDRVERRNMVGLVKNVAEKDHPGFEINDWVVFARWAGCHYETQENTNLVLMKNEDIYAVWESY